MAECQQDYRRKKKKDVCDVGTYELLWLGSANFQK
jgi:hypothetical protein